MVPKITSITETTMTDAQQKTVPAIKVTYTVGTHGPFVEVFPKAGFNPSAVLDQLKVFANHVGTLTLWPSQ